MVFLLEFDGSMLERKCFPEYILLTNGMKEVSQVPCPKNKKN